MDSRDGEDLTGTRGFGDCIGETRVPPELRVAIAGSTGGEGTT
jgi:hypothetical protein